MISATVRLVYMNWWTWVFALVLVVAGGVSGPFIVGAALDAYDNEYPPAEVSVRVMKMTPDEIVAEATIKRARDCESVARYAIGELPDGSWARVNVDRVDGLPLASLNKGETMRTTWIIYPIAGMRQVIIRFRYECSGRAVTMDAARIKL